MFISLINFKANKGNHGGQMFPYQCDMTNITNIQIMFEWIEDHAELGKLDICVCNAGVGNMKSLIELTPDEMKQMLNVNVISSSFCTQLSINQCTKMMATLSSLAGLSYW